MGRLWKTTELADALRDPRTGTPSIGQDHLSYNYVRADDGYGFFASESDSSLTSDVTMVFETGEIWSVAALDWKEFLPHQPRCIWLHEEQFVRCLTAFSNILERLELTPPYRWVAGIEGINGMGLFVPVQPGFVRYNSSPQGVCVANEVVVEGNYDPTTPASSALRPFFERIYEKCGITRPAWLNSPPPSQS